MAGYSGTPLAKKLRIKENFKIALINPPDEFPEVLGALPPGVSILREVRPSVDLILFFATSVSEIEKNFSNLLFPKDRQGGLAWLLPKSVSMSSWPRRKSL